MVWKRLNLHRVLRRSRGGADHGHLLAQTLASQVSRMMIDLDVFKIQ
jgi:hypothetical protein